MPSYRPDNPNFLKDLRALVREWRNDVNPFEQRESDYTSLSTGSPRSTRSEIKELKASSIIHLTAHAMAGGYKHNEYHSTRGNIYNHIVGRFMRMQEIILPDRELKWENMVMSGGGVTQLIHAAIHSAAEKDDILLFPVPTYGFFMRDPSLTEERVRTIDLKEKDNFHLRPDDLRAALSYITKENPDKKIWLMFINPHSPSGAVHDQAEVDALAEVMLDYPNARVIADMVYAGTEYKKYQKVGKLIKAEEVIKEIEGILSGKEPIKEWADKNNKAGSFSASPFMFDRTITLHGLSKAYGEVTERTGIAIGPEDLIDKMEEYLNFLNEFPNLRAQTTLQAAYAMHVYRKEIMDEDSKQPTFGSNVYLHMMHNARQIVADDFEEERLRELRHWEQYREMIKAPEGFMERVSQSNQIRYQEELDIEKKLANSDRHYQFNLAIIENILGHGYEYISALDKVKSPAIQNAKDYELVHINNIPFYLIRDNPKPVLGARLIGRAESGFFQQVEVDFVGKYYGRHKIKDGIDISRIFRANGVSVLPGELYMYPGEKPVVRVSFSMEPLQLLNGLYRIKETMKLFKDKPYDLPRKTPKAPETDAGKNPGC